MGAGARRQVEQTLLAAAAYPQFCLEAYNGSQPLGCAAPASLLTNMFDPAPPSLYGFTGYGAGLALGTDVRVAYMAGNLATFGFFLPKGFGPGSLGAPYVRSLVPLGAPLLGYASATDRRGLTPDGALAAACLLERLPKSSNHPRTCLACIC